MIFFQYIAMDVYCQVWPLHQLRVPDNLRDLLHVPPVHHHRRPPTLQL